MQVMSTIAYHSYIKILNKMLVQLKVDFYNFRRKRLLDTKLDLNKFKDQLNMYLLQTLILMIFLFRE